MGLFSFIGKAAKGIAHLAGGVLRAGILPIPFGGVAGKVAGALLHAKAPGGHTALKMRIGNPMILRAKSGTLVSRVSTPNGIRTVPTITALRSSPVMPGGAVATKSGVVSRGGGKTATPRRKRRLSTSTRRSRKPSGRKRSGARKLKFGSPAWRKKYLGHGRKRGRRKSRR